MIFALGVLFLFIFAGNTWILIETKDAVYTNIDQVPKTKVALVLGTSNKHRDGSPNVFFNHRIDKTVELYNQNKIEFVLVSGDNSTPYYNEPQKMKEALLERGIPKEKIFMDFAGFRTLDSVVRCKEVFGQNNFIIVTQDFHSYRALFIAKEHKINAVSYVGNSLNSWVSFQVEIREIFARMVAILDLYILEKTPKFLGGKETIG